MLAVATGSGEETCQAGKTWTGAEAGKGPSRAAGLTEEPRPNAVAREPTLCCGSSWEPHTVLEQGSDRWELNVAMLGRRPLPAAHPTCWILLGCLARHWVARLSK